MSSSSDTSPPIPPTPPPGVTPTLYNTLLREKEKTKKDFLCFLGTTKRPESPSSALNEVGILKLIFSFTTGDYEIIETCSYKVKLQMCHRTEHVFVEALYKKGGWQEDNMEPGGNFFQDEFCGSLCSRTIGLSLQEDDISFLSGFRNQDGSYYTEGQLRVLWSEYSLCEGTGLTLCTGPDSPSAEITNAVGAGHNLPPDFFTCEYCDGTSPIQEEHGNEDLPNGFHQYACDGRCMALPGDSIYWKFLKPYRIAGRWEPATDEELVERGWVDKQNGCNGFLYTLCENHRREHGGETDDE